MENENVNVNKNVSESENENHITSGITNKVQTNKTI